MKLGLFDRIALGIGVIFLGVIAARPFLVPEVAKADNPTAHFYVEPGVYSLLSPDHSQSVAGKVMIDMSTGSIWGFPTAPDAPYPIEILKQQPATSSPIYLGKFDLASARH